MADRKTPDDEAGYPRREYPQRPRYIPMISVAVILLAVAGMVWFYNFHFERKIGPQQPIPFSHRLHAGMKKIGCPVCHEGVFTSSNAGIPPLQTCMLCHEKIIVTYPPVQELRAAYVKGTPVEWVKVTDIPDFVYFTHAMHLAKQIDCSRCHGSVNRMDRVELAQDLTMGFCISCHREAHASVDCFTCHR